MIFTFDDVIFCLVLLLPLVLFLALAKKHWLDKDLRKAFQNGLFVGCASIVLVRLLYIPIELYIGGDIRLFLSAPREWYLSLLFCIGIVGLIEEGIKAVMAFTLCCFQPVRGLRPTFVFLCFAGCAMSFALIENIQYYFVYGPSVVLPRVLVSSTAHLAFSCITAWFSNLSGNKKTLLKTVWFLNIGIICSAIAHGIFDYILFQYSVITLSGLLLAVLSMFSYAVYEIWISALKNDLPDSGYLSVCAKCRALTVERIRFCPFCGNRVLRIQNLPTILKK